MSGARGCGEGFVPVLRKCGSRMTTILLDLQAPIKVRFRHADHRDDGWADFIVGDTCRLKCISSISTRRWARRNWRILIDVTFPSLRTQEDRHAWPMLCVPTAFATRRRRACRSAINDMVIPDEKEKLLGNAYNDVKIIKEQYSEGLY